MPRLTKRSVDALKAKSKDYFVWDAVLVGFGVRVLTSGAKTYQVQYRKGGRTRRSSIGRHGVVTVDQAFLIWARLLRRPFKLDWTPQGEPLTEAAAWCERVCRAAEPEIARTRIRTAALKVRERLPENSNLYNPAGILRTYFKRSGWLDKRS